MKISLLNYIIMKPTEGEKGLIVKSVPIPLNKKSPPQKLISAYGTKTTTEILSVARVQAIKDNLSLYRVDLTIDGGELPSGRINLDALPNIKFLNLERIQADIASAIMGILLQNNISEDLSTPMKILGDDPMRFNLLWEHPTFEHITTFSWNAPTKASGHQQMLKLAITKDISFLEEIDVRNYKDSKGPIKVQFSI